MQVIFLTSSNLFNTKKVRLKLWIEKEKTLNKPRKLSDLIFSQRWHTQNNLPHKWYELWYISSFKYFYCEACVQLYIKCNAFVFFNSIRQMTVIKKTRREHKRSPIPSSSTPKASYPQWKIYFSEILIFFYSALFCSFRLSIIVCWTFSRLRISVTAFILSLMVCLRFYTIL